MAEILKRDFTDETHCGRCRRGRRPLELGIAYVFKEEGPGRFAGPRCAQRDADNWGRFPDFTRAFDEARNEALEEGLAVARDLHNAVERGDVAGVDEARAVLEYLGLRVRLGRSFGAFPCLDFMARLHAAVEAGELLSPGEMRQILRTAYSYQRVNPRATPGALQACYALDVALTRLRNVVGSVGIIEGVQGDLRARGCLTQGQIDGVRAWFDRRGMAFPSTRAILR